MVKVKLCYAAALAVLLSLLALSCGFARLQQSAEDLQSSKNAYETCIRAAENVDQCAKEKAIFDADLAEYEARHKAAARYGASTARVTVNNNQ